MLQICKGASCLEAALIQEMRKREEYAGQKGLPAECRGPEREARILQYCVWKYVCVNHSEQGRGRGEDTDT